MEGIMKNVLLETARHYTSLGWHVLPLHNAIAGGRCSCGRANCQSPGKHPRTMRGVKDASTDPKQIEEWWRNGSAANIGIATGRDSCLLVIDLDSPQGLAAFKGIHAANGGGPLPYAPVVVTKRGWHIYFSIPQGSERIPCSTGKGSEQGVDVRADGGYVVAPPSIHPSGHRYRWDFSLCDGSPNPPLFTLVP
jgi:hypothetical protein